MNVNIRHVSVGSIVILSLFFACATVPGQEPAAHKSPESGNVGDAQVRYAEANLRLAEIELEIALTANKKIASTYSALTVQRLRNNVSYAKEMVRFEAGDHSDHSLHKLHLADLEMERQFAEAELAAVVQAIEAVPGSVDALEIARFRAAAEVARLAVDKARDPKVTQSPIDHLQWRIDRIRSELTRLYVRMDRIESRN